MIYSYDRLIDLEETSMQACTFINITIVLVVAHAAFTCRL